MRRFVSAHLKVLVNGPTKLVYSVAAAAAHEFESETLTLRQGEDQVEPVEVQDRHGTRLHTLEVEGGEVTLDYEAVVNGQAEPAEVGDLDQLTYLRQSRYCQSDSLSPTAVSEFSGLRGRELLVAVTQWVEGHLTYAVGSSGPTDGAIETLLNRQGVCRDFAHLTIALLRALNVPARLVSVYAPGLSPMEFHAVTEAFVDGAWHVVDATRLAPRRTVLRIATGRDAADTAFLTNFGAGLQLQELWVNATVDQFAPEHDDTAALLR